MGHSRGREVEAVSVSRGVLDMLRAAPFRGHVLGVHGRACTLAEADGRVIAVVLPEVGNGPLNIVLDARDGVPAAVQVDMSAGADESGLHIGPVRVALAGAAVWEPRPDWQALRARTGSVEAGLPAVRALAGAAARGGSLLSQLDEPGEQIEGRGEIALRARRAALALRAGWGGDAARLREAAAGLAGLGAGLTPAGDDFLAGAMLRAWLAHPSPAAWCHTVAGMAAPRTTTLAAALLRAAARGECAAAWHVLLGTLAQGDVKRLEAAVHAVLAHGATSGADMLAGFLGV
jgi:hypothetical protein